MNITFRNRFTRMIALFTVFALALGTAWTVPSFAITGSKAATKYTVRTNQEWYDKLDFDDRSEWENANRGLIDAPEELEIVSEEDGHVVWSQKAYDFLDEYDKAPDTVNPSLWENAKNNHVYGLFKVTDGIYQVRGYDMANITFIESDNGWIIFDTSMTRECAEAAKALVEKNLGTRPVKAVLISHSHIDHFGGVRAFTGEEETADPALSLQEQADSGKVPVIVPEGFSEHAVAENLNAGTAMSRRAQYQYGSFLPKGETGGMSIGIGMGQSRGTTTFVLPTYEVKESGEKVTIDGVEIEFQLTPGTEAPAEMNAYFPQRKALWMAENCTGSLHNLYTLRGAEVRDGNAWAEYIMEAVTLFGDKTDVVFQSHNWPHWGTDTVKDYMINTAAIYKYINDEALTLINQGYTSTEIADMIQLPAQLEKNWYTRQYYGTLKHNAKAVYQKYMGWYDANPVNLNKLTPEQSAKKWIQYLELGSLKKAMKKARKEYKKGRYQWVAEFTNTVVFADPTNEEARNLCADALEQLAYQAESGTWRNCYLTAALELRQGNQTANLSGNKQFARDIMVNLTPAMAFDYMGIMLDKHKMDSDNYTIKFVLTDTEEIYTVYVRYGAILYAKDTSEAKTDVTVECTSKMLLLLISGSGEQFVKNAKISGITAKFDAFVDNLGAASGGNRGSFNIIEP
ncbi:MAG: MBL fold metallo-hydrolase [Lachnospiraceae bacterium]|nr:MBL fold metallo-hydrolase [Lachnospiraceae bacterium]